MATSLSASTTIALSLTITDTGTLNNLIERLDGGVSGFSALTKSLSNGTSADQAQKAWYQEATITAGSNSDIDLTSLTDRKGVSLSFSNIKWVLIRLTSPAVGAKLIFKGSTATNPWQAWKGAAADNEDIPDILFRTNNKDGWATSGTNKVLRLNNPGGSSVTYDIVIVGH